MLCMYELKWTNLFKLALCCVNIFIIIMVIYIYIYKHVVNIICVKKYLKDYIWLKKVY